ncbi:MAG: DUF4105 domain-containing protein, partial [Crocinitomicaceae bacterium]|nr:DUF4105 domain-containing protein [Crocinitomicaceae bacterium]
AVSDDAKFSVLTCTSGADLYTIFGHSAIRFQDSISGKWIDWVYNYGTFLFSDDFYFRFAKGKLDYMLSKSTFPDFQYEYIVTGRGVYEQELNLTREEKQRLFELLEINYLPENQVYRYDFFYDNCATRIREMIKKATGNRVDFTYVSPKKYTFRDAIQNYLQYKQWSDLGIDLVLGLPCDKVMEKGDAMFLPDSLMKELSFATLPSGAFIGHEEELLPPEYFPEKEGWLVPFNILFLFLAVQLMLGWWRKNRGLTIADRILFFVSGLVGCVIIFLWFFTDHTATAWNLNLIWANPLNIFFAFINGKKLRSNSGLLWIKIYGVLVVLMLAGWLLLPQELNPAVLPLSLGLVYIAAKSVYIAKKSASPEISV